MAKWTFVAELQAFPPGSTHVVDADGTAIAVYNCAGKLYAIEDVCTHDGGELASGELDGEAIICPRHGARFCLRTGAVLAAPAYEPIACFPLRIESGRIEVRDDRWD